MNSSLTDGVTRFSQRGLRKSASTCKAWIWRQSRSRVGVGSDSSGQRSKARHIIFAMPRLGPWKPLDDMSPSDFSVFALSEAYRTLVQDTGIDEAVVRSAFAEMLGYLLVREWPEVVTKTLNEVLESKRRGEEKSKNT